MNEPEMTLKEFEHELKKIRLRIRIKTDSGTMTKEDWLETAAEYEKIGARANAYYCKRHAGVFEPIYSPFVEEKA
jgi:hypothetical protein